MQGLLKAATRLRTEFAQVPLEVENLVDAGGEGEVYRVSMQGNQYALKWYYPETAHRERLSALKYLIQRGAPSERFVWPLDLVVSSESFGYVMPWRDKRFVSIADLLKRRVSSSFQTLTTAGYELAHNFYQLHAAGLCYRDVSLGNLSFDPSTGEISISDNDNVGVNNESIAFVGGTPGFMAPEVVRGDAQPSTDTDLFSLAVLLFYLLAQDHPLNGEHEARIHAFDLPAMKRLYGYEPVFIFDPNNNTNRPVVGIHDNAIAFWPVYPQSLRDLFTRSFTDGLFNPRRRVIENEWRDELLHDRDTIFNCPQCQATSFYDIEKMRTSTPHTCWHCHQVLGVPPRLRVGKRVVVLTPRTHLYLHHLDPSRAYDFGRPVVAIVQHPRQTAVLGLKNLSQDTWVITKADGSTQEVPPDRSATITDGLRVHFGKVSGEIRA